MSGIARMLRSEGNVVTGTDTKTTGNGAHLLPLNVDAVIYSDAVISDPAGQEELSAAQARGIKTLRRIDFIAERMQGKTSIAIAGAHGKSTTTALIGWGLAEAEEDPTVFIGADLKEFGGSARGGAGEFVVTEACEWNRQFLDLNPTVLVLTTIDKEHLDTYPGGIDDVIKTFHEFASQVDKDGFIVANGDDQNIHTALDGIDCRIVWFGKSEEYDYELNVVEIVDGLLRVGIIRSHETGEYITSHLVGKHHAANVLAAVVTLHELGISSDKILKSMTSFPGLKRRFEYYRNDDALIVVDDYAHHPTEISATIGAAKIQYPNRRIVAVFQPHLSQRTTDLFEEFIQALSLADKVFIAETFEPAGRVVAAEARMSSDIVNKLKNQSIDAEETGDINKTITVVENKIESGDVIIVMGATNIWKVAESLADWSLNDRI